ncbi:MAG: NrfD/PsrC family molybdoenzyme membrane anchor subunit [Myxococcota bacterium]
MDVPAEVGQDVRPGVIALARGYGQRTGYQGDLVLDGAAPRGRPALRRRGGGGPARRRHGGVGAAARAAELGRAAAARRAPGAVPGAVVTGRAPRGLVAVLLLITIVGGWAVGVRVFGGIRTTNMTNAVAWGLWVALYIYFIGLSAGSFLLSSLVYVFGLKGFERVGPVALFSALVLLGTGLVFIGLDLGHIERGPTTYTHPQFHSVLSWEIMAYGAYVVIILTELWLLLRPDLARLRDASSGAWRWVYRVLALGTVDVSPAAVARNHRIVGWVAVIGLPVAVAVHGGTGAIFAVAKARPYWFSPLIPVVFVISALASGSGALTAIHWATGDRQDPAWAGRVRALGGIAVGMVAFDVLLLGSDLLVGLYSQIPEHTELYRTMLFGPFGWVFWGWQVGLGALVPIGLYLWRGRRSPGVAALAGALVAFGAIAVRLDIVVPSLTVPVLPGLDGALADLRYSYYYFPSWVEWLSSAGLMAGSALGWIAGYAVLPLRPQAPE